MHERRDGILPAQIARHIVPQLRGAGVAVVRVAKGAEMKVGLADPQLQEIVVVVDRHAKGSNAEQHAGRDCGEQPARRKHTHRGGRCDVEARFSLQDIVEAQA